MPDSIPAAEPPAVGALKPPRRGLNLGDTFAALRFPNYRLWFYGQLVSLFGSWMQSTAQAYFIFELTQDPTYLGLVGFAAGVPTWIFSLMGGVVADRISRRNLLVITQTAMMGLAFILSALTFTGLVRPWHILVLAFSLGIANAFDAPARQAFVREMVDRETMTNAIALNSTMFNIATAVGPAVAGLAYALVGPAWCFLINGITFIAVIVALLMMKLPPWVSQRKSNAFKDIQIGFGYLATHETIKVLILALGALTLFGMASVTLMPAWATDILGGGATTNGLLQSARGVGAMFGGLMIAAIGTKYMRGRLVTLGSLLLPVIVLVYSAVRWTPLSLIIMITFGWAFMMQVNLSNALVQTEVPDDLRGRVMSIYTLSFLGLFPVGSLLAGKAADLIGEPLAQIYCALILLAINVFIFVKYPAIRKMR